MKKSQFDNLNSHYRKIWDKLMNPDSGDFHYSELKTLLVGGLGFEESNKGKTSGSRVKFDQRETMEVVMLHKPHPGDVMTKASVKSVRDRLRDFYESAV
jgi:hypothetical protein